MSTLGGNFVIDLVRVCRSDPIRSSPVQSDPVRSRFANGLFDILIVFGSLNVFHKSCWISFCVSDFCGYMYM